MEAIMVYTYQFYLKFQSKQRRYSSNITYDDLRCETNNKFLMTYVGAKQNILLKYPSQVHVSKIELKVSFMENGKRKSKNTNNKNGKLQYFDSYENSWKLIGLLNNPCGSAFNCNNKKDINVKYFNFKHLTLNTSKIRIVNNKAGRFCIRYLKIA